MDKADFDAFQKEMEDIRRKIRDIADAKRIIDQKLSQLEKDEEV